MFDATLKGRTTGWLAEYWICIRQAFAKKDMFPRKLRFSHTLLTFGLETRRSNSTPQLANCFTQELLENTPKGKDVQIMAKSKLVHLI